MKELEKRLRTTIPDSKKFDSFWKRVKMTPQLNKIITETDCSEIELLEEYYLSYPASPIYKNDVIRPFLVEWYKNLGGRDTDIVFPPYCYKDKTTELLKLLHKREGITKTELAVALGESERRVQTDLRLLSPSLGKEREAENASLKIGGNVVKVKIKQTRKDNKKYYYTPNTIHPIILLPNLMQTVNLLMALSRFEIGDDISEIAQYNGVDIWLQLSDYCKNKIKTEFATKDSRLNDFIHAVENISANKEELGFVTEREMSINYGNIIEQLMIAAKASRICNIEMIESSRCYERVKVRIIAIQKNNELKNKFELFSDDGSIKNVEFTADECQNVELI